MADRRPIRESLLSPGPGKVNLLATRCRGCGQVFFPRLQSICLSCLSDNLEEVELEGKGNLHSFSTSHISTRHFKTPYTTGFIDLDAGVRLFAQLGKNVDSEVLETGMSVELVEADLWDDVENDETVFGYCFIPVKQ